MARILIIDDDEGMCFTLTRMITLDGHEVKCAHSLKKGLREAISDSYDVVFLDVLLPEGNGLDILPAIRNGPSKPEVIIMTAVGNHEGAELAITNGAWDYVQKPFSLKELRLPLIRALQYRQEKTKKATRALLHLEGIVGRGPAITHSIELLGQAAGTDGNVLITGETGTGKELFARAIHENSGRSGKAFVVVDCGALPETLVENTLFGHEKGAFTGADKAQEGLITQADGGTLFLDEVGELPLSIQRAFLRVLQERRFRPVGGRKEVASDFRLIAATNRKPDEMVKAGKFRSDLLFRLRSLVIDLPPLRGRTADIRDLALYYVSGFSERYNMGTKGFSPEFLEALWSYHWPGNVRELIHALERALTAAREESTLFPVHLPTQMRIHLTQASLPEDPNTAPVPDRAEERKHHGTIKDFMQFAERRYLIDTLALAGGDISEACRITGLSKSSLYERLRKHKIERTS